MGDRPNPAALGDEWVVAFATRRVAGPARWAFGPPPERAVQNQQNGASNKALLLRPFGSRGPDAREARKLTTFVAFRPGVRPHKVQLHGTAPAHCPPRARGPFIPRGNATENHRRGSSRLDHWHGSCCNLSNYYCLPWSKKPKRIPYCLWPTNHQEADQTSGGPGRGELTTLPPRAHKTKAGQSVTACPAFRFREPPRKLLTQTLFMKRSNLFPNCHLPKSMVQR